MIKIKELCKSINRNKNNIANISTKSGSISFEDVIKRAAQEKFDENRVLTKERETSNKLKDARYNLLMRKDTLTEDEESELKDLSHHNDNWNTNNSDGSLSKVNELIEKQSNASLQKYSNFTKSKKRKIK